jgi:hypothetical protein
MGLPQVRRRQRRALADLPDAAAPAGLGIVRQRGGDIVSTETSTPAEDEFSQRMQVEGDLGLLLCEHIWDKCNPLRLGGQEFKVVGCDEVPGYEDENMAVLLRRMSDGKVFEADIDVTVQPVLTPAQREARIARLRGQLTLPGVTS